MDWIPSDVNRASLSELIFQSVKSVFHERQAYHYASASVHEASFEEDTQDVSSGACGGGKLIFQKSRVFVNEGHTIGVEIALGAYDTDFGFAIGFEKAENQVLLGKRVCGETTRRFREG